MTTTTNLPEPPAWLNLDALFPVREAWTEGIADLAEEGRALLPALADFVQRAAIAKRTFTTNVGPVGSIVDDPYLVVAPFVGFDKLDQVVQDLATQINGYDPDSHIGGMPEWASDERNAEPVRT